nr:sigma-70 family RNA polymerase sigma factor [Pseudonocardiales bacterium]
RECLGVLRRSRRELPADGFVEQVASAAASPETRVLRAERNRAVDVAVAALPTRRRQLVETIFRGPDNDHMDYEQVSRLTGMPVGSIGPTRGRALMELRGRMRRAGFGPEDLVA